MAEKKVFPKEKKKKEGGLRAGVVGQVFRFVAKKILETRPKDASPGKATGIDQGKAKNGKKGNGGLAGGLNRGEDIRSIEEQLFGDNKKKNKK